MKHDFVITELPEVKENILMTKTTIIDTVIYENEDLVEERIQDIDRERDEEYLISSLDSDHNSNEGGFDSKIEHNHVSCGNCGQVFISLYHHERHFCQRNV